MIDENVIKELLRLNDGKLYHREGQELEFKEQYNFAGLADYLRDFAAFANNRGGYIIFGVKDKPRTLVGLSKSSQNQFEKIDPEKISGFLLDIYSADIRWDQSMVSINGKMFGAFRICESPMKPIIAKKDEGRENLIKNGDIYYRYGGRTQKIQAAELENIIVKRVEATNKHWLDLMAKIGKAGPQNAAILDTKKSLIEKGDTRVLVLDEGLAEKLKFIKEGEFVEENGATALKLVGDVVPIDKVEVIRKVRENLTKTFPLSATELAREVYKKLPEVKQHEVWGCIKENGIKDNLDYSAYNFRNKKQEDNYKKSGEVAGATPSIYNQAAVDFIVRVLKEQA